MNDKTMSDKTMSSKNSLVELIYYSRSITNLTEQDFEFLLAGAREKNTSHDISGAIYYADGYFLQLIEGPRDNINRLFQSISHDARHYDVSLISFRNIQQRHFAQWSMAYLDKEIAHQLPNSELDQIDLATCLTLFNQEVE